MNQAVKSAIHTPCWKPYRPATQLAERAAAGCTRVLEIGPGHLPFAPATEFIDWLPRPEIKGRPVHQIDLNRDRLPFDDQSIDFLYTRHTLEDLYNPLHACREIARVARAGWIETPSPLAESCRGVDGNAMPWRGYVHHHSLIWVEDSQLMLLPKMPLIEYIPLKNEDQIAEILNSSPIYWNTYFYWTGELRFHLLQHDQEFSLGLPASYAAVVVRAMQHAVGDSRRLAAALARVQAA